MSLARYNDSLTLEQLIVAHNKIKANAASLYNEAQLLFEIKMASLYADIFQVDFFTPNEIISAEMTKAILELVKHRLEFINSISPSDDTIRAVKKEDIRLYREKLRKLGLNIYGKAKRTVDP